MALSRRRCALQAKAPAPEGSPRLTPRLRQPFPSPYSALRTRRTACIWVNHSCLFHNLRHPHVMAEPEINAFLTHLPVKDRVAAPTRSALTREYPDAPKDWHRRWVFPQNQRRTNRQTTTQSCHHLNESLVQKAVRHGVINHETERNQRKITELTRIRHTIQGRVMRIGNTISASYADRSDCS